MVRGDAQGEPSGSHRNAVMAGAPVTRPTLLEFVTQTVTLQPGDLMSSGTCGGTGMGSPWLLPVAGRHILVVGVTGVGYLPAPMPILCARRIHIQAAAPRMGATLDLLDVGSGEQVE
jgi:hypothetical protein